MTMALVWTILHSESLPGMPRRVSNLRHGCLSRGHLDRRRVSTIVPAVLMAPQRDPEQRNVRRPCTAVECP